MPRCGREVFAPQPKYKKQTHPGFTYSEDKAHHKFSFRSVKSKRSTHMSQLFEAFAQEAVF